MPMDRGRCEEIVGREIGPLQRRLGVPHWSLVVSYGPIDDDGVARTKGRCTRQVDYDRAHVEIDPEEHDDEADLLKTLRHELFHVVLSPFDLYMQAADQFTAKDSPEERVLERVFTHAVEQAAIGLERLHEGLTAAPSDRLAAERDAYREAFRDTFVAYLKAGHGKTDADATAKTEEVMAETERRIAEQAESKL
jgi:hypothetical protein